MGIINLSRVLDRADAVDIAEGRLSYFRYHEMMQRMAGHYEYPLRNVVAAFVSLSPNNDYVGNLRSLATCLHWNKLGIPVERITVSTYNACKLRALAYLNGADFLGATKGKKIRAFYRNILNPLDPEPVTVDGHMIGCWYNRRFRMKEVAQAHLPGGERWNYERIAEGVRRLGKRVGLLGSQVQAILWFTWKRLHGVLAETNYQLFNSHDQWGVLRDPARVRVFPLRTLGPEVPALNLQLSLAFSGSGLPRKLRQRQSSSRSQDNNRSGSESDGANRGELNRR